MDIKEAQQKINELITLINNKHGFPYPNLISLMKTYEELGELTQLITESTVKSRKSDIIKIEDIKKELGNEIADVFIAVVSIANDYGVDLEEFVANKLNKHFERWKKVE